MDLDCQQRTVAAPVFCSGVGIHSGKPVNLTIKPAPVNHGIKFKRTDLPNSPGISAHFNMVVDTSLATVIGYDGFIVSTIEHLMATFAGLSIDNALVEIDAYEMPIMDGSAAPFVEAILAVGLAEQPGPKCFFEIKEPIEIEENDKFVGVYPASAFKVTYTIEYDHPLINTQTCSVTVTPQSFVGEICKARTFGFFQEYEILKAYGLARGGSLDNVVVIDKDKVLNPGGLHYPDEFVRHKMLDCIGDFALLGMPILGHLVIRKSGHAFNHAFLQKFFSKKDAWQTCSLPAAGTALSAESKSLAI